MNDFLNNISRYPRFFISSFVGLLFVIVTPFQNLFKNKKFRLFSFIFLLLLLFVLYFIIANMIVL